MRSFKSFPAAKRVANPDRHLLRYRFIQVVVMPHFIRGRRISERELVPLLLLDQKDCNVDRDQTISDVRHDLGAVQVA